MKGWLSIKYHYSGNKYSYKYEIKSKTIDPHHITDITDLYQFQNNKCAKNYRRYRNYRFLSSVGSWSVERGAHIQAFTFSSEDHGRLSIVRISEHPLFRLKITVGCRVCAYPSIRVCGV